MTLADISLMVSVLVVVVILAKMVRAIRLLDGRVSLLQEQLEHSRTTMQSAAVGKRPVKSSGRTPIEGVPITPSPAIRHTPPPEEPPREAAAPGEATTHVIGQAEADAVWTRLEAEQERLRKAMGRDFQVRASKRSASDIRGKPIARALTAQEVAKKLERR